MNFRAILLLLLTLVGQSSAVLAGDIVADPSTVDRPAIWVTETGVPQVNINTPSAAGVSLNQYSQFDVDATGAVLANNLDAWQEGGAKRVAMHDYVGYLLTGTQEGADSFATVAALAPQMKELNQTLSPEAHNAANLTLPVAIGEMVDSNMGAMAANVDWNNRELHSNELESIDTHASDYADEKLDKADEQSLASAMQATREYENEDYRSATARSKEIEELDTYRTENAKNELATEALHGVSDDFAEVDYNPEARNFLDNLDIAGQDIDGQTMFGELDRESDEYKNSSINIETVSSHLGLYNGVDTNRSTFASTANSIIQGAQTDLITYPSEERALEVAQAAIDVSETYSYLAEHMRDAKGQFGIDSLKELSQLPDKAISHYSTEEEFLASLEVKKTDTPDSDRYAGFVEDLRNESQSIRHELIDLNPDRSKPAIFSSNDSVVATFLNGTAALLGYNLDKSVDDPGNQAAVENSIAWSQVGGYAAGGGGFAKTTKPRHWNTNASLNFSSKGKPVHNSLGIAPYREPTFPQGSVGAGKVWTKTKGLGALWKSKRRTIELFTDESGPLIKGAYGVSPVDPKAIAKDARSMPNIATGSQARVIANNPYIPKDAGGKFTIMDYLPEASRITKKGGEIVINGTTSNKYIRGIPNEAELQKMGLRLKYNGELKPEFKDMQFKLTNGNPIKHKMKTIIFEKVE